MSLIGLELSDAGIMAADSPTDKLLAVDGPSCESPGFALPEKSGLLVGKAAESKAHLFPRQIINHFWDHLNTDPLAYPGRRGPQSTAEVAYRHLDHVWRQIQHKDGEIIVAVPGFQSRQHLGLILGIANELSMPVKGFVPLALAAAPGAHPGKMILHLDIHLHRLEVTYLKQEQQLTVEEAVMGTEKGLIQLHKQWAEAIGQEFVSSTRFDPFHQAASEQQLYDRLPGILYNLQHSPSIAFDMTGGSRTYGITLSRDLIARKAAPVYTELTRMIEGLRGQHGATDSAVVLQLSHRLARLPGCKELLAGIQAAEIVELGKGAGARGALELWPQLAAQSDHSEISYFTSRPLPPPRSAQDHGQTVDYSHNAYPTHLLYHHMAYRISEKPLFIGYDPAGTDTNVQLSRLGDRISSQFFSIQRRGREVVVNNLSPDGTYVNEARITGSTVVHLGQRLRNSASGETFQLIACLDSDET